jgi:cyanophycin synthetase
MDLTASISHHQTPLTIRDIKVLRGANYYSSGQVIVMRLDLGIFDEQYTDSIDGLYENLKKNLPGLNDHHCSENHPGGFFKRIQEGTLLGHVAEHIAIELQIMAGMDVGFGKTGATREKGVYNVVFRYYEEKAGIYAGKAAVIILNNMLLSLKTDIEEIVKQLVSIKEQQMPGLGTQAIIDEARKRDIPVLRLDPYNLIQLGTGRFLKKIRATMGPGTSYVAAENMRNSFMATRMLRDAGIPVPISFLTDNINDLLEFKKHLAKPIVIKSPENDKSRCIYTGLNDIASINLAFAICQAYNKQVIVQEQIPGETYRLLVIGKKFVAATWIEKCSVIGTGKHNIVQLIEILNTKQQRTDGDKGCLTKVIPDEVLTETIGFYGYHLGSIPEKGVKVVLNPYGNPSDGALTKDVTGIVHPLNRFLAERAAEVSGLDVAGVNVICPDISKPIADGPGVIVNVLAAPDFRMHINPWKGKPRKVESAFVDMIFPKGHSWRIPLFSVTGSAGKTICTYLINYMLEKEGYATGLANSDGIFSEGRKIIQGNMATHYAANLLLKDPAIESLVLETSIESLLDDGLGYEFADYAIVLNTHDEVLPGTDLENIEDIAYTQSIVAEEVYKSGFTILNAADPMVVKMKEQIYSNLAMFSDDSENPLFVQHIVDGGWGCSIIDSNIVLWRQGVKTNLVGLQEIILWENGNNIIFTESILAAILTMAIFGITPSNIRKYLQDFRPAFYNLNGRLNFATINSNKILIDQPSGPLAFKNIRKLISDSQKDAVFYIDSGGNIPSGLSQYFVNTFKGLKMRVYCFSSALQTTNRLAAYKGEKRSNLIISLQERYFSKISNKPDIKDKCSDIEIFEIISQHFTLIRLVNEESFIKELQKTDSQSIHIILSWNIPELYSIIHPLLDQS